MLVLSMPSTLPGASSIHGTRVADVSIRFRHRLAKLFLVATLSVQSTACYTYHVYQVGGAGGREQGNQPSTEWNHATLHAFAWGLVRRDLPVSNCRQDQRTGGGIEEIKVNTNLVYILASTATLGVWVPLQVSWRCAKPSVLSETLR
jgi:hypothetical protein